MVARRPLRTSSSRCERPNRWGFPLLAIYEELPSGSLDENRGEGIQPAAAKKS